MSQLPEDFLSLKSLKSLTATASITWILLLVIDVIFISGMDDEYAKLKWIWIIGFVIAFALAILRLYAKEEKEREKGDKIFLIFNAALIFLYASGFNGFTRELGGWTMIQQNLEKKEMMAKGMTENTGNIFGMLLAWTPSILANQTAVWPDMRIIAENNILLEENLTLRDSLQITRITLPFDSSALLKEIVRLREDSVRLAGEIQILLLNATNEPGSNMDSIMRQNQYLQAEVKRLRTENANLKNDNAKLQEKIKLMSQEDKCEAINRENELLNKQLKTLLTRIEAFNEQQGRWQKVNEKDAISVQRQVNAAMDDKRYYDFLFLTPIETKY